jgi:hypothetical protein
MQAFEARPLYGLTNSNLETFSSIKNTCSLSMIHGAQPSKRLKFGDEKLLRGVELFNRKVRRDPIIGITPPVIADSDFRNSYCIMEFCGVDLLDECAYTI